MKNMKKVLFVLFGALFAAGFVAEVKADGGGEKTEVKDKDADQPKKRISLMQQGRAYNLIRVARCHGRINNINNINDITSGLLKTAEELLTKS